MAAQTDDKKLDGAGLTTLWGIIKQYIADNPSIPKATASVLGGIMVGTTLAIDNSGVLDLASGIVTAGTYKSVTVDTYGRVTAGSNPNTLAGYGITDAKIDNGAIIIGANSITPITSVTSSMITTALGYTPADNSSLSSYLLLSGGTISGGITPNADSTIDLGSASAKYHYLYVHRLVRVQSIAKGDTYNSYQLTLPDKSGTIAVTSDIPTNNNQLTNGAGYITGITKSMVTTALGYTPPTTDTDTWRTVQCNGTSIGSNTLNLKAGTNVSLSNSNGTITITSTDTNTWRPLGTGSTDACAGNDSRLSNSRPASDVYSWAKAASKPSYSYSEISGTCGYASSAGSATKATKDGDGNTISSTYLKLSGGTLTGDLKFQAGSGSDTGDLLFSNSGGTEIGRIWLDSGAFYVRFGSSDSGKKLLYGNTFNSNLYTTASFLFNSGGYGLYLSGSGIYLHNTSNSWAADILYVNTSANVGLGTSSPSYKFHVNGACAATSFPNTSDVRKKNILSDKTYNIKNIANAPIFAFTWKDYKIDSDLHIGSSAQYWKNVIPEAVSMAKDEIGTLSMQYDVIALASCISVAKETVTLKEKVALLETRVESLEKKIREYESN